MAAPEAFRSSAGPAEHPARGREAVDTASSPHPDRGSHSLSRVPIKLGQTAFKLGETDWSNIIVSLNQRGECKTL